jgi:hypothetical protein
MTVTGGSTSPAGGLGLTVIRGDVDREIRKAFPDPLYWPARELSAADIVRHGMPQQGLPSTVNQWRLRNLPNLARGVRRVAAARTLNLATMYGTLFLQVLRGNGDVEDLGLASMRVVTTAGVGYIVDSFQNLVEPENMKYHGFGTGTTAEASSDTALVTELTTQYATDNTRPTGSTTEGASANIYRTVATLAPDSGSPAITEHGVFSQAATGGGVLLDRSKFAAVNLDTTAGDSIVATYDLTFPAGS